jgi:hypothetical protein
MRDDLFKGSELPKGWKTAAEACLRQADQGVRSTSAIEHALSREIAREISPSDIKLMKNACEAQRLPLGGHSNMDISPAANRALMMAQHQLSKDAELTGERAVRYGLAAVARETLSSRLSQAESHIVETAPVPQLTHILSELRGNFTADINAVADRLANGKTNSGPAPHQFVDPDEDLSI